MKHLKRFLAILICRFLIVIGRLMGKKGSSAPGKIALLIDKSLLSHLAAQVRKKIIVVCGTNGKTTTNNIIYHFLTAAGYRVACNNVGANMLPGVVCAFASKASLSGRLNCDYAAIEIDEASAVHVFNHFCPHIMVVTNLFRDQLDRYGAIDITLKKLSSAIEKAKGAELILNGDDPLTTSLAGERSALFFGVSEKTIENALPAEEGRFCRCCGSELSYNFCHYSQLGDYFCPDCGFKRPQLDFAATNVLLRNGLNFEADGYNIGINYRGFYNIYNILAALLAIKTAGESVGDAISSLASYKHQIGRMESFKIGGKEVILNLSKNPAGFNQAISTTLQDARTKDVIIGINDMESDGIDISWLWDCDFEALNKEATKTVTATGTRAEDMLLRLKYGGFDTESIFIDKNYRAAVKNALSSDGEVLYIIVNYTVLFGMQSILKELEEEQNGGEAK